MSDSFQLFDLPGSSVHGILQAKTRVDSHALLQGIFSTQGLNLLLLNFLHWQAGSLPLVLPSAYATSKLWCLFLEIWMIQLQIVQEELFHVENSSVQFSHSVVSDSWWPMEAALQASLSITSSQSLPNSYPLSVWCHPAISSSVVPVSSCLQSFPASGSFPRSQFFASNGQSIGVSASASVLPMNIQDWFPLGLIGLTLQSKELSRVFSNTTIQKHQFFGTQPSL